jgi:hypothetical protein
MERVRQLFAWKVLKLFVYFAFQSNSNLFAFEIFAAPFWVLTCTEIYLVQWFLAQPASSAYFDVSENDL